MTPQSPIPSRRELLRRSGVLAVVTKRPGASEEASAEDAFDIHVCLTEEGGVYADLWAAFVGDTEYAA